MKKLSVLFLSVALFSISAFAQKAADQKAADKPAAAPTPDANAAAGEVAKAALAAHGGDKLKAVKTMVLKGSVEVTVSTFPQAIPGTFATIVAGDKYRLEINSMQSIKQISNGTNTYSSLPGFYLPPITRVGFAVLSHIGDKGYTVTALSDSAKKKKGFRLSSPEGYATDFFVDEKTGMVKGFESSYEISGRLVTTSAEIDKYKVVDGISLPERYVQRFDLGQMTAYSDFKAKEIVINGDVPDDYFAMPQ